MDRRIPKTKRALLKAFVELLAERGFDKVTIHDLAERADVNRGTVYLHFVDKYDLLDQCIGTYVDPLLQYCLTPSESPASTVLQGLFTYVHDHRDQFRLFLTNEVAGFFRHRIDTTLGRALDLSFLKPTTSGLTHDATVHFFTSGLVGVLEWWVTSPEPCSVEDLTQQLLFLVEPYRPGASTTLTYTNKMS